MSSWQDLDTGRTSSWRVEHIESWDGTRIAYQVGGAGERWLVAANGYGGTFSAWADLFALLDGGYRHLVWDYRGMHRSAVPRDPSQLTIEAHSRDLEAICRAEGIERAVLAGWSVGVQVALEHYRRRPRAVEALVLVNGAADRVLQRTRGGALLGRALPPALRALAATAPLLERGPLPLLRWLAGTAVALPILGRTRAISGRPPRLQQALQEVLGLDLDRYVTMALLADAHRTDAILPTVAVPTLVTSGTRDIVTAPAEGHRLAGAIPGARLREIPDGTHYALLEYPRLLASAIDAFVAEVVGPASSGGPADGGTYAGRP